MTTCDELRLLLHADLEDSISDPRRLVINTHLEQCDRCHDARDAEPDLRLRRLPGRVAPSRPQRTRLRATAAALLATLLGSPAYAACPALDLAHPNDAASESARAEWQGQSTNGVVTDATKLHDRIESWARNCATEIPWQRNSKAAMQSSQQRKRPLLVYVRCTHASGAFAAANQSVAAASVALSDAGYAKDLLFRAGALSDSRVAATIVRQFEPLMISYDFHSHGKGIRDANWSRVAQDLSPEIYDPEVGVTSAGSLVIAKSGSFLQAVVMPKHRVGDEFRFTAKVKSQGGSGKVDVYWSARGAGQVKASTETIDRNKDWTEVTYLFTPKKPLVNVLIMPKGKGNGRVWFDDLSLVRYRDGKPLGSNLLRNGSCDPNSDGADPLRAFGLRGADIVTPALLVVRGGKVTHRLHRVGAISADHINQWLHEAASVQAAVEPRATVLQDAWSNLSVADWAGAAEALAPFCAQVDNEAGDEAGFLRGMALHRLGQHEAATEQWLQVAGPTQHGRRAAACLLPSGPHLPQALSLRAWRASAASDSSEVADGQRFDVHQSLDVLLELQQANGAFVDHLAKVQGKHLQTWWDLAYTAIAGDALRSWRGRVDDAQGQGIDTALRRIATFLETASYAKANQVDAFNDPYALDFALAIGATETAQRYLERIVSGQQLDGSWTVYGPIRPTSFNTAQNLLALLHARDAGLEVSADAITKGTRALAGMRLRNGRFSYAPLPGFKWMTTPVGGVAREPLCEHALLVAGAGSQKQLDAALDRFVALHAALRKPTKHYSGDFNRAGHGSYFFLYAHKNAAEAAAHSDPKRRARVHAVIAEAVLASREADGSFVDHALYGRSYGTAMALSILGGLKTQLR